MLEKFLVYKLETFKNCKQVKHMIMIRAIIYIFLYVIFDQQLKITFRKSSGPPKKIHSPPLKIQKLQIPANIKIFLDLPLQKG